MNKVLMLLGFAESFDGCIVVFVCGLCFAL